MTRQQLILAGRLCPGPHYEPGMTPCQLPHGTVVFRVDPEAKATVPYWTVGQ